LIYSLGLYHLSEIEKMVFLHWLNRHTLEDTIPSIYLTMAEHKVNLGYISSCLAPLCSFSQSVTEKGEINITLPYVSYLLIGFVENLKKCKNDADILKFVTESTITILFDQLETFLKVEDEDIEEEDLSTFIHELRKFISALSPRISLSNLPAYTKTKIDLLAFFQIYHLTIHPKNALLSVRSLSPFYKTVFEEKKGSFESMLWLASKLKLEKEGGTKLPLFVEELTFYFFHPDRSKLLHDARGVLSEIEIEAYDNSPSEIVESELILLVSFLSDDIFPNLSHALDIKVKGRILNAIYTIPKWQRCIMDLIGRQILRNSKFIPSSYQYHPLFTEKRKDDKRTYHILEDIYYFMLLKNILESSDDLTFAQCVIEFKDYNLNGNATEIVLKTITKHVFFMRVLKRAAQDILKSKVPGEAVRKWEPFTRNEMKEILHEEDAGRYFLQLLPHNTMIKLLGDEEALRMIGLEDRILVEIHEEAPFHQFPFVFERESEEGKEYHQICLLLNEGL